MNAKTLISHTWAAFLILCLSAALQAKPKEFEATYRAEYRGIPTSGEAVRKLTELDSGDYELTTSIKALFFSQREYSKFSWNSDNEMISRSFSSKRKIFGRKKESDLLFDWQNALIRTDKEAWEIALEPGVTDRHSYQVKLRRDLQRHLADPGRPLDLRYTIADRGKLKTYQYVILKDEMLRTPAGDFQTLKVAIQRKSDSRSTILWLAVNWDLLLVKLEQVEKGKPALKLLLTGAMLGGEEVKGQSK